MASGKTDDNAGVTGTVRLASYNIHAGLGMDRRFDAGRIAAVLGELRADVIAMQEVEHHDVDGRDLLDYLAHATDMTPVPGPTLLRNSRHYGNALLTRLPLLAIRRVDISHPGREPRGAIDVDLDVSGRRLRIVATHLGLRPGERRRQVERLLSLVEKPGADITALAGDFNEWLLWGRPLRWLRRRFSPTPHVRTWPSGRPFLALDRIWVEPGSALVRLYSHISPLARHASDHLPLVAELYVGSDGTIAAGQGARRAF
jgi:endonuclease/exonuclease/phosphatase family metal-dependent hydrolase